LFFRAERSSLNSGYISSIVLSFCSGLIYSYSQILKSSESKMKGEKGEKGEEYLIKNNQQILSPETKSTPIILCESPFKEDKKSFYNAYELLPSIKNQIQSDEEARLQRSRSHL
jgi:hypothetical protein